MRNSNKKTKIILLVLLVIAILIMTIAFSAMSSTLNIRGTGKVDVGEWDIRFENLQRAVIQGTAQENQPPTIKNNTTLEEYSVILKASGDSVTYNFTVHNYGAMNAEISELNFPERPTCTGLATNNEQKIADAELVQKNLSYTFKYAGTGENVKTGDSLLAGESKELTLSIGYYGDELPSEKVNISGLGVTMTYSLATTVTPTPDEGPEVTLMAGGMNSSNTAFLNGPITRESIETIKIARKDEKPANPIGSWDISESQDRSIKAYYTQASSGKYNVIICAENGRIKANNSSSYLFSNMPNLKQLDLSALTTSETTNVDNMCRNCTNLENVIIGDRMKKVGNYSFTGCSKLKSATIGEDVKEIGYGAFNECKALQTVEMKDNIEKIGGFAFNRCETLQRVHYSTSLKEIGKAAFQYCFALENIDLPEGLEIIDQFAFNHNSGLTCTKITIPSTVRVIGNYYYPTHMFYDCGKDGVFVEFEVPETSQYYKAVDGILYTRMGRH